MSIRNQAIFSGAAIFFAALLGAFLIGRLYSEIQARQFIEAMAPSLHTLCFAVITAAATVISLLLTTVSFMYHFKGNFSPSFYEQIKLIARLCTVALIVSVSILLVLTMPLTESQTLRPWFIFMYYALIGTSALLAATIIAIIILLSKTMRDIIQLVQSKDEG